MGWRSPSTPPHTVPSPARNCGWMYVGIFGGRCRLDRHPWLNSFFPSRSSSCVCAGLGSKLLTICIVCPDCSPSQWANHGVHFRSKETVEKHALQNTQRYGGRGRSPVHHRYYRRSDLSQCKGTSCLPHADQSIIDPCISQLRLLRSRRQPFTLARTKG